MRNKLGIVIPNWNGAKFLSKMLDSILEQTYQDWITFVVDDQSTDDSIKILQEYHYKDARITYTVRKREPKGAQTCRNIGIELASSCEYICIFDSDDIIAPYCFQQRVDYMESHPNVDYAAFPAKSFRGEDLFCKDCMIFGFDIFNEDLLRSFLLGPLPIVGWTNIYRTISIKKFNHYWDENILSKQDSDYNIQAILKGMRFQYARPAKVDYFWRLDTGSKSITKNIKDVSHFDSHIYRLTKQLDGLTIEQCKKYEVEITTYLLESFRILAVGNKRGKIKEMVSSSFFKKNRLVALKFRLLYLLPLHKFSSLNVERTERLFFKKSTLMRLERWGHYNKFKAAIISNNFSY